MCLKRYARIRNSRGDETRLTRTLTLCVFRRRTDRPTARPSATRQRPSLHRHALTQPIPNPYEGSFNSNLPFRDCSESCIFLSRTNVYHSITNRETFVPVSRPTFRLPPSVESARVPSDISFGPRYILPREQPNSLSCEFNFNLDFFPFAPTRGRGEAPF